ncbi:hypothetical protein RFI_26459, partial [Reticulomyxa filosa]
AVDVHGGFGRGELRQVMKKCNTEISRNNTRELWVFLDEVNTSPDIGWFKELICDHSLDGVKISSQIKVIAACNPYRPRKIKNNENVNINDPLSKWVYRVFPLCETMKEYVWHFGQLSQFDEKQYIQAMVREKFNKQSSVYEKIQKWESKITEDIVASQQFLRKHLANEFIVSLRDVSRCLKFFHWLMQQPQTGGPVEWTGRALNIALGLCYYFRLDESGRKKYDTIMFERNQRSFTEMLNEEIENLSKPFEVQRSVVMHNILKENLFVLFFCIATATPIILVGKPGTSKTLSLQIMLNSLSHTKTLRCIAFQGTRYCKPNAIKEIWDQTERYSKDKGTTTFLLFDEIGLAEQSPHNPLKILHQLLEKPKIPFVGISNWNLDAAKMNRMVMHFIPSLGRHDLINTAKSIVSTKLFSIEDITKMIKVYEEIINCKTDAFSPNGNKHFFGARDFYALVKYQATLIEPSQKRSLQGYLRNFDGLGQSKSRKKLHEILAKELNLTKNDISQEFQALIPVICVQKNLMEKKCAQSPDDLTITRHCMIISEHHYSWQLLLEYNILNNDHVFLFGSYFTHDTYSNISNYNQLNKIIDCMEAGRT